MTDGTPATSKGVPQAVPTSGVLDAEAAWRERLDDDRNDWADADADESFWADSVDTYEDRFVEPPAGLDTISELVNKADSVLEIGPGTGRYTRRLASLASRVTAVEDAKPARSFLRERLEAEGHSDAVDIRPAAWEDVIINAGGHKTEEGSADSSLAEARPNTVAPHDVVLACWSLYRQPSLDDCLDRILTAADKGFVLVDSPGGVPPHRRIVLEATDGAFPHPPPRHAYYCAALADRGVYPAVQIESAPRVRHAPSRSTLLDKLLGEQIADPDEYAEALSPWVCETDGGWTYRYELPIAVLSWTAPTARSDISQR